MGAKEQEINIYFASFNVFFFFSP